MLDHKRAIVIIDIRSLGYYKIQQGVLHQRLTEYYSFESKDPYLWLQPNDPRIKLTDKQIIESTIDLSQSCLSK